MSDERDPLTRDQEDFFARLSADELFADVKVLEQRKGVTESDIEIALATLNEQDGKIGAVAIVLMPELLPNEPEAPGPEYRIRSVVQVITAAIFNDGADGTGKSAEHIARRVRQLLHLFSTGRGTYTFAGMEPIQRPATEVSYGVMFTRLARDVDLPRLPLPMIDPEEGAAPQSVTIEASPGADVYYTLDGSYPWSGNADTVLYSGAIAIATAKDLRAVAYKTGYQPSNVAEASFT